MNIATTQFSLENKALEIYLSGCDGSCVGCHNPELWDFAIGDDWVLAISDIIKKVKEFDELIDHIWILGGEPLLQNHKDISDMLIAFHNEIGYKKIWLFTRFEFSEIPRDIKKLCDYIKCGKYVDSLKTNSNIQLGIKLATSNQYIKYMGGEQ